jgi:hypothetical protein
MSSTFGINESGWIGIMSRGERFGIEFAEGGGTVQTIAKGMQDINFPTRDGT